MKSTSASYKSVVDAERRPTLQPAFQAALWLRRLEQMRASGQEVSSEELHTIRDQIRKLEGSVREQKKSYIKYASEMY